MIKQFRMGRSAPLSLAGEDPATAQSDEVGEGSASRAARSHYDWVPWALGILLGLSLMLRVAWLDKPIGSLIFDESYYVNAARVILGWSVPADAPYAQATPGSDPNSEHPPLAKLLIAGAMRLLGDNAWGWRLPSIIFGTISIPLLYGIARRVGASPTISLLATYFYAFDNLVFVHSRIATLDIFMVAFILLGIYLYLLEQSALAGFALALATLCKIGGVYGLGALVLFVGLGFLRTRLAARRWDWASLRPILITGSIYLLATVGLLAALDHQWSTFKNPFEHIASIFRYGFALTRADGPQGQESAPWQWLLNEVQMTYLRVDSQVVVNGTAKETRALIYFRGALNPFLIIAIPLGIASAIHSAWTRRDDLSFLTIAIFVATYLPFWPAALLAHRISYIFYFLPTIPALALGMASFLHTPGVPRVVRWAFVGAILVGFYGYFPFHTIP